MVSDPERLEIQAFRARTHKAYVKDAMLGPKPGKTAANGKLGAAVIECARCGDLVSWAAAKAAATQRGRSMNKWKMCDADGCTSGCKKQQRAPRERAAHAEKQMSWAAQLMDGAPERVLVARPRNIHQTDMWHEERADVTRVACAVAARHGKTA